MPARRSLRPPQSPSERGAAKHIAVMRGSTENAGRPLRAMSWARMVCAPVSMAKAPSSLALSPPRIEVGVQVQANQPMESPS